MSAVHITPLSRNQLLDLESLVANLIRSVNSTPSSAVGSPNASVGRPPQVTPSCAGLDKDHRRPADAVACSSPPSPPSSSSLPDQPAHVEAAETHPVLRGAFVDTFTDPHTSRHWRLYDKMLYLVWWSHRPSCCAVCGMQEAWVPSSDAEMRCAQCGAEAGSTRLNDIVEERGNNGAGGDDDDDDDDDDVDSHGGGGEGEERYHYGNGTERGDGDRDGGAAVRGGGASVSAAIPFYSFCYEWLQRILRLQGELLRGGGGEAASVTMVVTPAGEALPTVLRAAYDMASLLCLPGMSSVAMHVNRGASLYLSLVLHRFATPFPLFALAASQRPSPLPPCTAPDSKAVEGGSGGGDTATSPSAATQQASAAAAILQAFSYHGDRELQWVDVELVGALLGVELADFFDRPPVSTQYLQNALTLASLATGAPVPSVLWHPLRVPGRAAAIAALAEHRRSAATPIHTTQRTSGISPDHTALVVALELARQLDEQPLARQLCRRSSGAAASKDMANCRQQSQRVGQWLDALGLYPFRRVYRDASYFNTARCSESGDGDGDGDALKAFDASLLSLSAAEDFAAALAYAERKAVGGEAADGARRETAGTAPTVDAQHYASMTHCGRPSVLGSAATASVLTTPSSPFVGWMENLLPSPCANALLHVFARTFHVSPLELADVALRSGLYRGPSNFLSLIQTATRRGCFYVMPLARRVSPVSSVWSSVYMCLHSSDRPVILAALHQLSNAQGASRERTAALGRLLQKLLRKHQSSNVYQMNYTFQVVDDAEKHFKGVYFLSSVLANGALATFTCVRSGRKTVTFNAQNRAVSLCFFQEKERLVKRLEAEPRGPLMAQLEGDSARAVVSTVLGTSGGSVGVGGADQWASVVRSLDRCGRVRRRMRVPMLASRIDALASIREAQSMASHPIAGAATLLGWGETESVLESPPPVDVLRLRWEIQHNLFALPSAALLYGLSENRITAMYASLVALLEFIECHTQRRLSAMRAELVQRYRERSLKHRRRQPQPLKADGVGEDCRKRGGGGGGLSCADGERGTTERGVKKEEEEEEEEEEEREEEVVFEETDMLSPLVVLNTWVEELLDTTNGDHRCQTSPYMEPPPSPRSHRVQLTPSLGPAAASSPFGGGGVTITKKQGRNEGRRPKRTPSPPTQPYPQLTPPFCGMGASPPLRAVALTPNVGPSTAASRPPPPQQQHNSMPPVKPLAVGDRTHEQKRRAMGSRSSMANLRPPPPLSKRETTEKRRTPRNTGRSRLPLNGSSSSSSSSSSGDDDTDAERDVVHQRKDGRAEANEVNPPPLQLALSTADVEPSEGSGDSEDSEDEEPEGEAKHFEYLQEVQLRAAQQERARQAALAAEEERRQRLVRQHLLLSLPTYWEVLLGVGKGTSAAQLHREPQGRCLHAGNEEEGGGLSPSSSSSPSSSPAAAERAITQQSIDLFKAEECRRRLHRLCSFVKRYWERHQELSEMAANGLLQPVPSSQLLAALRLSLAPATKRPRASADAKHAHGEDSHGGRGRSSDGSSDGSDGDRAREAYARRSSPSRVSPSLAGHSRNARSEEGPAVKVGGGRRSATPPIAPKARPSTKSGGGDGRRGAGGSAVPSSAASPPGRSDGISEEDESSDSSDGSGKEVGQPQGTHRGPPPRQRVSGRRRRRLEKAMQAQARF